ncbi:alpha/beta hydrolase [Candidatus Saccharibacteria bacterium]|nr:alpha/beta hydrolase [Candidatus Saccharibacteria bacterium]
MNVVVNGLMTNYQKVGKGKTLLFLHGWGDSSETFAQLTEQLKNQYTLLLLNMPGFGGAEPPHEAWGLIDYARFVSAWLKKIDADPIYAVVGHSFGGSIVIVGVSSEQIKADKVVLLASGGIRNKNFVKKKALYLAAKTLKVPLRLLFPRKVEKIKSGFYKKIGSDLLLIPHMRQTFIKMVREDVQLQAKAVKQPTLLIYGDKDRETPVSYGHLLAADIPNSHLEIIPATGHFLHQEKPEQVAGLIKKFLN